MLKSLPYVTAVVVLMLSTPSHAVEAESPLPQISTGILDNGLRYTIVPLKGQGNRIDIRLQVDAGALEQTPQQEGVAHMVEHMVFHHSEGLKNGVSQYLQQHGWQRGKHYNAVTNHERTMFMMSPPDGKQSLDLSLNALSQMVYFSQFNQQELNQERSIILEEWRGKLGVADRMNEQRMQAIRKDSLYPQRSVTGTEQTIQNMPLMQLQQFYRTWYVPKNMKILIIGDVDHEQVQAKIKQYFATVSTSNTITKPSYDIELKKQLRIVQLQDSESGSSQISYIYRFTDHLAKQNTPQGFRQRLLQQIAIDTLTQQVRQQAKTQSNSVSSLVVRKSEIGPNSFAVGIFADVVPQEHQQALPILLKEIVRLQQNQLPDERINSIKSDIRNTAEKMLKQPEQRSFSDWVQKIVPLWQQNQDYLGSVSIGQQALQFLPTISNQEVNQQIHTWLNASDQLIQYSTPGMSSITLPSVKDIFALQQQYHRMRLTFSTPITVQIPQLTIKKHLGYIKQKEILSPTNQVWTLSNGDRIVWLQTALAQEKLYFTAQTDAGFLRQDLNPWQAQIASQLLSQTGPEQWQPEQLQAWKKQYNIQFSIEQQPQQLIFSGQTATDHITSLLQLYATTQQQIQFNSQALASSTSILIRKKVLEQTSVSAQKNKDIQQLRFEQKNIEPDLNELKQLHTHMLTAQWNKIRTTPTTFYILTAKDPQSYQPDIETYLAGIERQAKTIQTAYQQQKRGVLKQVAQINLEPRAEIRSWSQKQQVWTPEIAMQVSIIRNLAEKYLKQALRDQMQGIYRMKINSELDDKNNLIKTDISFTTAPERADELWQQTLTTLKQLPSLITPEDIQEQSKYFQDSEKNKAFDINTLQKRLILSNEHYKNADYLEQVGQLTQKIDSNTIRNLAQQIFDTENYALYVTKPQIKSEKSIEDMN
ncbi:M16 family metallopeptidase [Acinetobacter rathckeae]|uniref:M16 family metallopeptidase n=1 Tax=Acinetobacter rathckeae TaxID=2605272 RepID=UPI0018A2BA81|nr:pitrilysin family protein [Acinetobacter rathckeae]MBF7688756.1 insulinase family protein [Acinetobacter rathckeae]MBF7696233.1 insulinase family protein [Acinetobacter rathckeae]